MGGAGTAKNTLIMHIKNSEDVGPVAALTSRSPSRGQHILFTNKIESVPSNLMTFARGSGTKNTGKHTRTGSNSTINMPARLEEHNKGFESSFPRKKNKTGRSTARGGKRTNH